MKSLLKISLVFALLAIVAGTCFAGVAGLDDLKDAKVGVWKGSIAEELVKNFLGDKAANMSTYDHISDLIDALKEKEVDAVVLDEAPARYFAVEDDELKVLADTLESDVYAIAFKKGNPLRDDVNKVLAEMKSDGSLISIIAKYLEEENPDPADIDLNKGAKNGKLWVGCAATFPPYEVRTPRGFVGIDVELCAAIAKKLDKELVMVDYRFDILPEALNADKIDMICSAYIVSEEREKIMDFSEPYDANQEVIIVLK